jgi:hypothetical protein
MKPRLAVTEIRKYVYVHFLQPHRGGIKRIKLEYYFAVLRNLSGFNIYKKNKTHRIPKELRSFGEGLLREQSSLNLPMTGLEPALCCQK